MNEEQIRALTAVIRRTVFSGLSEEYLSGPEGQAGFEALTFLRHNDVLKSIVPWVARHIDLANASVLEIGCGAGSSTAAFAQACRHIEGYDIDAVAIEAARERMPILGIKNVGLHCVAPELLLSQVRTNHPEGFQVVLCYAVLEHQTLPERLETIRTCWNLLPPGGLLVVADTPNRLTYTDHHTSRLPFFNSLPHDLAVAYAGKSPRPSFAPSINADLKISEGAAVERLIRWGRGVSYHEFELVLGDLNPLVVGDGFDPEIVELKGIVLDERLLYTYALSQGLGVPPGFWRQSLDVILRKPDPSRPTTARERVLPISPVV